MTEKPTALIVGVGAGLSASLARKARAEGLMPLLAARTKSAVPRKSAM